MEFLKCAECKADCSSLVTEWRGMLFKSPRCPNCANDSVKARLKSEREAEGKGKKK